MTDGNDAHPIAVIVERDGEPVVDVVGEVDLSTAGQVERAITELAARGGRVVDVSRVAFLDSSGVTALLRSARRGHAFVLRNPSPAVTEVLAMAGLTDTLPIEG